MYGYLEAIQRYNQLNRTPQFNEYMAFLCRLGKHYVFNNFESRKVVEIRNYNLNCLKENRAYKQFMKEERKKILRFPYHNVESYVRTKARKIKIEIQRFMFKCIMCESIVPYNSQSVDKTTTPLFVKMEHYHSVLKEYAKFFSLIIPKPTSHYIYNEIQYYIEEKLTLV